MTLKLQIRQIPLFWHNEITVFILWIIANQWSKRITSLKGTTSNNLANLINREFKVGYFNSCFTFYRQRLSLIYDNICRQYRLQSRIQQKLHMWWTSFAQNKRVKKNKTEVTQNFVWFPVFLNTFILKKMWIDLICLHAKVVVVTWYLHFHDVLLIILQFIYIINHCNRQDVNINIKECKQAWFGVVSNQFTLS